MKRLIHKLLNLSLLAQWGAAFLIVLAIVPRVVGLGHRPLMHDESLFAYYSYSHYLSLTTPGAPGYLHIPMLHGPTLMLMTGHLFKWFGDSITVARLFVALVSLVGLAAGVALWPRRLRWWLAPLLFTSPILLFYSRFFRDDMLVATTYLLATVGFAYGLSRRSRWRPLWAAVGACFALVPLALMESALFFQAAAVTFFGMWAAVRFLWRRPAFEWRLRPRATNLAVPVAAAAEPASARSSGARRRRRHEAVPARSASAASSAFPSAAQAVAVEPEPPSVPAPWLQAGDFARRDRLAWLGWLAGAVIGAAFVLYVYGVTFDPNQPPANTHPIDQVAAPLRPVVKPLLMMRASWDYWMGQHKEHRIEGPLHYHLPILATYELPILLLLALGLAWDAVQRRQRLLFYAIFIVGFVMFWIFWRSISYNGHFFDFDPDRNIHAPPPFLRGITGFLHIQPDLSMLVLGLMIAPLLAWAILMVKEHRVLAGWLGWWAACSLFQYSSAGEKVPWLAMHIALPLYMALGWLWAPLLWRMSRRGHLAAIAVIGVTMLIAMRNDYFLIGARAADPHERLVYNHTTPSFDLLCKSRIALWSRLADRIPLNQRVVPLVEAPGWPGVWYFRHCGYQLLQAAPDPPVPTTDLMIGDKDKLQPLVEKLDRTRWAVIDTIKDKDGREQPFSLRDHWMAPWPEEDALRAWLRGDPGARLPLGKIAAELWNYYWFRETWTEPGGFPIIAIEPVRPRAMP